MAASAFTRTRSCTMGGLGAPRALLASLAGLMLACGGQDTPDAASLDTQAPDAVSLETRALETRSLDTGSAEKTLLDADPQSLLGGWPWPGNKTPAVALALEVKNGVGQPLRVREGSTFFINQIDIRTFVTSTKDEGLRNLIAQSDFGGLGWWGVRQVDQESIGAPGPYTRRRFFRNAAWMDLPSHFIVEPVDSRGRLTGVPILLNAGTEHQRRAGMDDFFIRRFRGIQTASGCATPDDCSASTQFEEEAILELRNAYEHAQRQTLTLRSDTRTLRLRWSLRPAAPYEIPVEQVRDARYSYGFRIGVEALTPPRPDGTYAPGTEISFQLTLRDGAGNRLHDKGYLPPYNEVAPDGTESGLQYYRAFFDATTTYYRRKHRERMLMTQIIGPAQNIQPIRSIVALEAFLDPEVDEQVVATPERDGVFSQFATLPFANVLFGGAFIDPNLWNQPNTDTWQFKLPDNAAPGTYLVTVKGRRVYLGEDLPGSTTIEIQVGTPQRTQPKHTTGPCTSCHSKGGELGVVLHANDNRAACAGCHAPLAFELEGPIFVRTHFIHSRSNRFDAPLQQCSSCHLTKESIQRTSKAACLSCHKSYPDSHVAQFGPIESMYVGGGAESFQQCTGACHTRHPGSGL
ncbi:cytochrome C [Myxococcus sp. AB056]|uniref:cytochrome C n=1 Tax=Myxococcus sp. AB056 TaxID=2562792 RepID=UPI001146851E|nr:cytochrome C [Myxococcus sp. AB056]